MLEHIVDLKRAKDIERRFVDVTGGPMLELDSPTVTLLKAIGEVAYERFQSSMESGADKVARYGLLFATSSAENINSTHFGRNLSGEYFSRVKLGKNIRFGDDVSLLSHGGIIIGDNVVLGDEVGIMTIGHMRHHTQRTGIYSSPVRIEDGAIIEDGAVLCSRQEKPLVIGKGAIVKAGSVVVGNVADHTVVSGKPAVVCSSEIEPIIQQSRDGFTKVTSRSQADALVGTDTVVTFPIYMRGGEHYAVDSEWKFFNRNCQFDLEGELRIGKIALFGPGISIKVEKGGSLEIGEHVWIGAAASIHVEPGQHLTVGSGSIIAAGAHITEDVQPNVLVAAKNEVKRHIGDGDIHPAFPSDWRDMTYIVERNVEITNLKGRLREISNEQLAELHLSRIKNLPGWCP